VGAHDGHLRGLANISNVIACTECHANVNTTSVVFTNHMNGAESLDWGSLALNNGAPGGYDPVTHTCSTNYCHNEAYFTTCPYPNGGSDTTPVWNDVNYFVMSAAAHFDGVRRVFMMLRLLILPL
jgi:predicted CxxxxCH...CXXCH cytochrome family protein